MIVIIEGIVLKSSDYQEKSKILQVFTKEYGLIGVYLKGANNYKSENYLLSQPISHASFNVNYSGSGLSSSFKGELINSFQSIKTEYDKNIYVFHLFELIIKTIEQHQKMDLLYDLLLQILMKVESSQDELLIKTLVIAFELKLLFFIGLGPILSNCVECGKKEDIINFDIMRGGFVCKTCQDFKGKSYSIASLQKLYELTYTNNLDDIIEMNLEVAKELRMLVNDFYHYHVGFKTNSSKFFK